MVASSTESEGQAAPGRRSPAWRRGWLEAARRPEHRGVVLLVEDDLDIRSTLAEFLDGLGYLVVEAADGEEAMETLRGGLEPDLIILDLMMPRVDGWHFLQQLREDPGHAHLPVLVTSASSQSKPPLASACLPKPFNIDELDRTVARLCAH